MEHSGSRESLRGILQSAGTAFVTSRLASILFLEKEIAEARIILNLHLGAQGHRRGDALAFTMASMCGELFEPRLLLILMTIRLLRTPAAFVFGTALLATFVVAQTSTSTSAPASPYGGSVVQEILARVNDRIISRSDYDRALQEFDTSARSRGETMQEISEGHKDLLRNLIDQQLWLSKGKELSITGETELIKRLNEIRKQYNLETLEDLEKAAKEQGVSYEDFKANIRNNIITQEVMRQQVGQKIQFTPGEAERYYEEHKQEYAQQESVQLSEILISVSQSDDATKMAAAKVKAEDIEAKLHAGGDFAQLARSFSDGTTASQGGELGQFRRGALAQTLEDKTFNLKAGEYTEPVLTKQGYIILKVTQHTASGIPPYKDVEQQVEEALYLSRMEPAIRAYLTTMREQAYIDIKTGYADTGASVKQTKPIYSAYTPPSAKKKKKVERTRYRESVRGFRQKVKQPEEATVEKAATPTESAKAEKKKGEAEAAALSMKPGKKEKIRYGQAPQKTLPEAPQTKTEDAGAVPASASTTAEPVNPLETSEKPTQKTRFSARAKTPKKAKTSGAKVDTMAPAAADAGEVADRQTQAAPLGLSGDTSKKNKKKQTVTGEKTRISDKKKETTEQPAVDVPAAPAPQNSTPATTPATQQ
jgi:peptidyl-prolyl cis-trans isomerase SurA